MIYRLYYKNGDRTMYLPNMVFKDRKEAERWEIIWNSLGSSLGTVYIYEDEEQP